MPQVQAQIYDALLHTFMHSSAPLKCVFTSFVTSKALLLSLMICSDENGIQLPRTSVIKVVG